ncbi:GrdX family protein [Gemella cuniculi]|uniref:GrdX family protein n=1 Tax=Gemella cuniculi TaxID=150240 RepID=UPI0004226414|nr:GrdX family protein [Gemella cuniculi]
MKLVTNNPKFRDAKFRNIEIEFLDNSYLEILIKVRDYIYEGWELMTHPLYGSVKPNETIYRSIVIRESRSLNIFSTNLISEAIETYRKFKKNKLIPNWSNSVKDDFSVIDFDLIKNAITRM